MSKLTRNLVVAACAALPLPTLADTVGLWIGADAWHYQPKGYVQYQGTRADAENDLHLGSDTQPVGWIAIEHPIPLLPNLKVSATRISTSGRGSVTNTFQFGGVTYSANETVDSQLSLDQQDAILYYSPLDNVVNLDVGLDIKHLDGDVRVDSVSNPGNSQQRSFKAYVPLVYLAIGGELPLTGLSVTAEGSGIAYQGSSYYDVSAKVAYQTAWHVGLEAGYRSQRIKLDNVDGVYSDLKVEGPFAGLFLHF